MQQASRSLAKACAPLVSMPRSTRPTLVRVEVSLKAAAMACADSSALRGECIWCLKKPSCWRRSHHLASDCQAAPGLDLNGVVKQILMPHNLIPEACTPWAPMEDPWKLRLFSAVFVFKAAARACIVPRSRFQIVGFMRDESTDEVTCQSQTKLRCSLRLSKAH